MKIEVPIPASLTASLEGTDNTWSVVVYFGRARVRSLVPVIPFDQLYWLQDSFNHDTAEEFWKYQVDSEDRQIIVEHTIANWLQDVLRS